MNLVRIKTLDKVIRSIDEVAVAMFNSLPARESQASARLDRSYYNEYRYNLGRNASFPLNFSLPLQAPAVIGPGVTGQIIPFQDRLALLLRDASAKNEATLLTQGKNYNGIIKPKDLAGITSKTLPLPDRIYALHIRMEQLVEGHDLFVRGDLVERETSVVVTAATRGMALLLGEEHDLSRLFIHSRFEETPTFTHMMTAAVGNGSNGSPLINTLSDHRAATYLRALSKGLNASKLGEGYSHFGARHGGKSHVATNLMIAAKLPLLRDLKAREFVDMMIYKDPTLGSLWGEDTIKDILNAIRVDLKGKVNWPRNFEEYLQSF